MTRSEIEQPTEQRARCRYCSHEVVFYRGVTDGFWATPMGERPAPGAVLPIDCPKRPIAGTTSSFDRHQPAL